MELIYAKNPIWANRSQTMINLTVRFGHIDRELPFAADANDVEAHGREMFAMAQAGQFGEIAPFNPTAPSTDEVSISIRNLRNHKLETEVDPVVSNPLRWATLSPEQQQAYADYRLALLNMPNDPAFPWYGIVVVENDFGFEINESLAPWPTLSV